MDNSRFQQAGLRVTGMRTAHRDIPFPDGLLPPLEARDVSGTWRLVHWITQSSYTDYEGLEIVFDMTLEQAEPIGNTPTPVWGEAFKVRVGGLVASPIERSTISLEGDLSGKVLRLRLEERVAGRERVVVGQIDLIISSPWLMRGSFTTDAAGARGVSIAMRDGPDHPPRITTD